MNETYVTLTGRVGSEVQLHDAGGQALATFRVASTPRRRRKDGEWGDGTTTWFQVKAWRRLAGNVKESLRVGDPVVITGRLEADVWVREDGTSSTQLVVTATSVGPRPRAGHLALHQAGAAARTSRPAATRGTPPPCPWPGWTWRPARSSEPATAAGRREDDGDAEAA